MARRLSWVHLEMMVSCCDRRWIPHFADSVRNDVFFLVVKPKTLA